MSGRRDCRCPRARHQHGTLGAYQYDRCRCFGCCLNRSKASAAYARGESWIEADWPAAVGSSRRLQALTAIGYSDRMLAERLGVHPAYVARLRAGKGQRVTDRMHRRVDALYDELWDRPYDGPYSVRTRSLAARKGWLPPLAWDDDLIDKPPCQDFTNGLHAAADPPVHDEIAVEEAMRGRRVRLTRPEMTEAHRRLTAQGHSAREIADRLGTTTRTVTRRRAEERVA